MSREIIAQSVSRETLERLDIYANLLTKWNPKINLVAKSTIPNLWNRHILDSVQVFKLANNFSHWADLGSGGGFPGLVAAIYSAEFHPEGRITLVESDQRKCAFLRNVAREAGLDIQVLAERIEEIPSLGADVLTARALASLTELLDFASRHLSADGMAVFPKGARWKAEVEEAERHWHFNWTSLASRTDEQAVILKIKGIVRV
ncbi:16S rRNA (guanine(527)-N(7))-methyltransferase RsmG [Pseudooceanicola algae]|uniref:Ribosomal RNA small subunit methyltransferase G n=1 Tax=Pseudooceanicola algae TaxID=1537215 RepID=A0A418SBI3_9RHOB|nr:16S rRNA (guanine(527)-N(7))-methyltransferase RsmG [Pseudooceanicola algae]QPM91471.1 Ribosomal RNA small subunit methyltransferase G [Pseudooceanicola algae]